MKDESGFLQIGRFLCWAGGGGLSGRYFNSGVASAGAAPRAVGQAG